MRSLLFSAAFVFLQLWDPSYGCDDPSYGCEELDVGKGVDYHCDYDGKIIPCENATEGAKAYFKCRDGYERAPKNTGAIERTCLANGWWSGTYEYLSCEPECGRIFHDHGEVTLDDLAAKKVFVPWHAEIINLPSRKNDYNQRTVCYGSLISNSAVLTAAHCLFDVEGHSPYESADLGVVLGQSSSATTLFRQITEVRAHGRFDQLTHTNDVAVLYLDGPVDFNESVNRVCLPNGTFFGKHKGNKHKRGNTGWVPAFRRPDNTLDPSPALLRPLPYIEDQECKVNIPSQDRHAKYFDRISPEKYCGGIDDCSSNDIKSNIATGRSKGCRDGWFEFNDVCYHVSHEKSNWETARSICQNETEGAELVSIHNDEQFSHVISLLRFTMWIGLNSLEDKNSFVWSDGTDFDYQPWARKEPNNLESQRCGEIINAYHNKGIRNRKCNLELHFACSVRADVCPLGWEKVGSDYCYFAADSVANWEKARADCKKRHGNADLASFHNEEEYNAILSKTHEKVWIGLTSINEDAGEYNWTWSDGTEFDYERWAAGEPNFLPRERCVEVRKKREESGKHDVIDGDWNNWICKGEIPHICAAPKTEILPGNEDEACLTQIRRGRGYGMVNDRKRQWYLEGVASATYDSFSSGIIKDNTCRTDVQLFARVDNFLEFIKEALEPSNETF